MDTRRGPPTHRERPRPRPRTSAPDRRPHRLTTTRPHHRSHAEQLGDDDEPAPLCSLLGTLHGLATFVRGRLGQAGPQRVTLSGEIGYLLGRLDWAAGQRWVADVAEDIRELHAQARAIAYDRPAEPLGACLRPGCGGTVYPARLRDPDSSRADGARYKRCDRSYTGLDLVRLAAREAQ